MKKFYKIVLGYSLSFWIIIVIGITLFSLSMDIIPVGSFGLKIDWFTLNVDHHYYTNGLYYKGLGAYFILFPRIKTMITKNINVINSDQQTISVNYNLIYRLKHDSILSMYNKYGMQYEEILLGYINNKISQYFLKLTEEQSSLTVQQALWNQINNTTIFQEYTTIEALWVNSLSYLPQLEQQYSDYQSNASFASVYGQQLKYRDQLKIDVQLLKQVIKMNKKTFKLKIQQTYLDKYLNDTFLAKKTIAGFQINISKFTNSSRMLTYYQPTKINFL